MQNKYKLRAECPADALVAIRQLEPGFSGTWTIAKLGKLGADVTLTFESFLPLHQITKVLMGIVDGHVMAETVQLESEYTGNRN
jgi:hypothetical protein